MRQKLSYFSYSPDLHATRTERTCNFTTPQLRYREGEEPDTPHFSSQTQKPNLSLTLSLTLHLTNTLSFFSLFFIFIAQFHTFISKSHACIVRIHENLEAFFACRPHKLLAFLVFSSWGSVIFQGNSQSCVILVVGFAMDLVGSSTPESCLVQVNPKVSFFMV